MNRRAFIKATVGGIAGVLGLSAVGGCSKRETWWQGHCYDDSEIDKELIRKWTTMHGRIPSEPNRQVFICTESSYDYWQAQIKHWGECARQDTVRTGDVYYWSRS